MVGVVVVSHSPDLARAAVNLALQMVHGPAPHIEIAAGTSDDRLGTDPTAVAQAVVAADDGEGVVVIMDLGSAVLSAELALEFLSEPGIKTGWFRLPLSKASLPPSFQQLEVLNSTLSLGMPRKHFMPRPLSWDRPSHWCVPTTRSRLRRPWLQKPPSSTPTAFTRDPQR